MLDEDGRSTTEQECNDVTNVSDSSSDDKVQVVSNGSLMPPRCSPAIFGRTILRVFFINREFAKVFFAKLTPALNSLIPLFYAGQIPNESALAIVSQYMFISILLEILQEAVVNSLFHLVGKDYENRRLEALQSLKICVAILFLLGSILCVVVLAFTSQLVAVVNTPADIVDATERYLYISAFSFPIMLANEAIQAQLLISTHVMLVTSSLCLVVSTTLLNVFLFGAQNVSAHWNVQQLGFYKIISAFTYLIINSFFFFLIEKMTPYHFFFRIPFFSGLKVNLRQVFAVSWGNMADSFVRNFFYFTVTLSFINQLGTSEIAAWNLLNTIVWSLLLLPSYALSNHVQISIGKVSNLPGLAGNVKKIGRETAKAMLAWLIVVALISGLFWSYFADVFSPNNQSVQLISLRMFTHIGWVFILFTISSSMNGFFIGTGKTRYIFYTSLLSNVVVYLPPWVLYLASVLHPTYWVVLGLYAAGMVLGLLVTTFFCRKLWKEVNRRQE